METTARRSRGRMGDGLPRGAGPVLAVWGAAAIYWYLQGWWTGAHPLLSSSGLLRASPLLAWAAVTPAVLRGTARLPVRGHRRVRNALVYLGAGTVFIFFLNLGTLLLWRAGGLSSGSETLGGSLAGALGGQFHLALLAWILLVGTGHLLAPRGTDGGDEPLAEPTPRFGDGRSGAAGSGRPGGAATSLPVPRPGGGVRLVALEEISWIEADGDRVLVHVGDSAHPLRERMKSLALRLETCGFLRIHRSTIVNLAHLREIQPWYHGDLVVVLADGTELRVARGRRESLSRALGEVI